MDWLNEILTDISGFLWGWPMIILLLGTHIFLTVRLKFPQRHILKAIRLSVQRDPDATGDVSQFGSLATALAATIGTGNIIGVATAIALGGPGAVLWCWLTGVFGISTKYAEGLLAIKYRVKTDDGRMLGGPMYALERGLGWKWLAVLFALFTALAAFGIGISDGRYRLSAGRGCRAGRREEYRPGMQHARTFHGSLLCVGLHLYPHCKCALHLACHKAHLPRGVLTRGGWWRLYWFDGNDGSTFRHRPRSLLQ